MQIFGVDIGGSGIKGAPVDLDRGDLAEERFKVLTPHPATPESVADGVKEVVGHFGWTGPVGITFPGVVTGGSTIRTAANVDKSWIDLDARALFSERLGGLPVTVLNDADAAGVAEMRFGAGRDRAGTVIALTLGTGVGSAIFVDGRLVPNTELGHMELRGTDAEHRSAAIVRVRDRLSWEAWAANVDEHLEAIHKLFWPQLFILGGGVSAEAERWMPLLSVPCEIVPAALRNDAGAVGAATLAVERLGSRR